MIKEDRKEWGKVWGVGEEWENHNITPLYPSRIPDLTFGAKARGGSWR